MADLDALYLACACDDHTLELMLTTEDIKGWVAKALRAIYKGLKGSIEQNLFELESQNLVDAIETGMGFEYGKPNFDLSLKLAQSGLWFAARKSYAEANDLAGLLFDNGTKRSWAEFRKLATPIVGKYNQAWLQTEYDTAVRSARMASVWVDMKRTKDLYPNVEYIRTRSAEPRESHLRYVGIIRPFNDPFWLIHTPPLAWRCKCSIRPTKQAVTPIPEDLPKPDAGLANNAALSERIFSEDHPYAKNAREVEEVLRKEFQQAREQMGLFFKVKTPKNGLVLVHPSHMDSDVPKNLPTAIVLADHKVNNKPPYNVQLPAHFEAEGESKPDLKINNTYADLKEPGSNLQQKPDNLTSSVRKQIEKAKKQGKIEIVVYRFNRSLVDFSAESIYDGIRKGLLHKTDPVNSKIKKVILIDLNEEILEVTREDYLNNPIELKNKLLRMKWHKSNKG